MFQQKMVPIAKLNLHEPIRRENYGKEPCDFGIYMENNLKFTKKIDYIYRTVRKYSVWVLHTFQSREAEVMKTL